MDMSHPSQIATLSDYGTFLERTGTGPIVEAPPETIDLYLLWKKPCFVREMHQLIHGNELEHHRMCPL